MPLSSSLRCPSNARFRLSARFRDRCYPSVVLSTSFLTKSAFVHILSPSAVHVLPPRWPQPKSLLRLLRLSVDSLSVLRRNHWGMGRFWRAFLASFCFTMLCPSARPLIRYALCTHKVFWEGIFGRFSCLLVEREAERGSSVSVAECLRRRAGANFAGIHHVCQPSQNGQRGVAGAVWSSFAAWQISPLVPGSGATMWQRAVMSFEWYVTTSSLLAFRSNLTPRQ